MQQSQEKVKLLSEAADEESATENNRPLLPQLFASAAAGALFLSVGLSFGYSIILVPQLLDEQNCTDCINVVQVTKEDTAWLVSTLKLIAPIGAPIGGFMMDAFGRLNLLKIAAIPTIIGWILIAAANSRNMLLLGRLLSGIPSVWGIAVVTYISEISRPNMRGSFLAVANVCAAVGNLISLVQGSLMHWRLTAWSCSIISVLPAILVLILPESPSWLVFKNRTKEAHSSLQWFYNKGQIKTKHYSEEAINKELQRLIDINAAKQKLQPTVKHQIYMKMFVQPTFYKPLFILLGLFFLQQASGGLIIAFYAVIFIKNTGTTIDPFLASVIMGVIRLIIAILHIWLTKIFNRRTLLLSSTIGMSILIGFSAMYTNWMLEGDATYQWIPMVLLMGYILFASIGLLTVPSMIKSEVFPLEIRGFAQNIIFTISSLMTFGAIQSYYLLNDFLGASGLQYMFSAVCLVAFLYCYVFVPETHKKTLTEIEDYFGNRHSYITINKVIIHNNESKYGSNSTSTAYT